MWISSKLNPVVHTGQPEEARVTLEGGTGELNGSYQSRNFIQYLPYGYSCALPAGCDVLTLPIPSGRAALGVAGDAADLKIGEIRLRAASGAYLLLRGDGSIVLNGLVIDRNGYIAK